MTKNQLALLRAIKKSEFLSKDELLKVFDSKTILHDIKYLSTKGYIGIAPPDVVSFQFEKCVVNHQYTDTYYCILPPGTDYLHRWWNRLWQIIVLISTLSTMVLSILQLVFHRW